MAEDKKSFILYCDQINSFENLDDDEAGRLIKHIFRYVNDMNPEITEKIIKIAFEPIKLQLKRDLVRYEETKEKKALNGAIGNIKRWHPDLYESVVQNKLTPKEAVNIAKHRKTSHSDNSTSHPVAKIADTDNDNVTDNVTVTDINYDYYIVNGKIEKGNIVDWYLRNQRNIFEAELMKLNISSRANEVVISLRDRFINGSSFNDYKHITNSFKKHITELEKVFNKPKPKLVR